MSVADFIEEKDPLPLLASLNVLKFDEKSALYTAHAATTPEVKELCADLKLLGKADFKQLLKWRTKMRLFRKELIKARAAPAPAPARRCALCAGGWRLWAVVWCDVVSDTREKARARVCKVQVRRGMKVSVG
jgi:hypothetical protein